MPEFDVSVDLARCRRFSDMMRSSVEVLPEKDGRGVFNKALIVLKHEAHNIMRAVHYNH